MGELTISFEGYWQCRQATDPDPSDDPRGASGYTFAIGEENDFDMKIRLQRDEIPDVDFRAAPPLYYPHCRPQKFGVFVSNVAYQGKTAPAILERLLDGKIRLHSQDDYGPRFELRNTITYHPLNQQGIFMPICPFIFSVESPDGQILIRRDDPLDPAHPERQVWEMKTDAYIRRCPTVFYNVSDEAMQAIGISADQPDSFQSYFQARKDWLILQRSQASALEREALTTRIYAIDNDIENPRMITRLGLLAQWDHTIGGQEVIIEGEKFLGGTIDRAADWRVRYWLGGYDGDLMRGYMRGALTIPFTLDGLNGVSP